MIEPASRVGFRLHLRVCGSLRCSLCDHRRAGSPAEAGGRRDLRSGEVLRIVDRGVLRPRFHRGGFGAGRRPMPLTGPNGWRSSGSARRRPTAGSYDLRRPRPLAHGGRGGDHMAPGEPARNARSVRTSHPGCPTDRSWEGERPGGGRPSEGAGSGGRRGGDHVRRIAAQRNSFEKVVVADYDRGGPSGRPSRRGSLLGGAAGRLGRVVHRGTSPCRGVRRRPRCSRSPFRHAGLPGRPGRRQPMWTWRCRSRVPTPTTPMPHRGQARRRAVRLQRRNGRSVASSRSSGWASSRGCRTSSPAMRRTSCSPRSTRSVSGTGRTCCRRLRLLPDLLHLDDHRGCLNPPVIWEKGGAGSRRRRSASPRR